MIDVGAFIGEWPFRLLPNTTLEALEDRLRTEGVERALVTPLEGLLHEDPQPVNVRWGERLWDSSFFHFIPLLDPMLPRVEHSLAACHEDYAAVGLRLIPNYHGYSLADERVDSLARIAGVLSLPILLQLRLQDVRSMHPLLRAADVGVQETLALARRHPDTTIVLCGCNWSEFQQVGPLLEKIPNLYLTLSHVEYLDVLSRLVDRWGASRFLAGTHAPLFSATSLRLKLDTAHLSEADRKAISQENALCLFFTAVTQ
jgi:predicted TIM-barrel fold metal-dependent hydrolase